MGPNLGQVPSEMPGHDDLGTLGDDNNSGPPSAPSESESPVATAPRTSTRSGRSVRFPRRFDDYLPVTRTALAHIPSKDIRNPSQAIVNHPASHPGSLGSSGRTTGTEGDSERYAAGECPPPDDPESVTTNTDSFGVYRVYSRKPLHDPVQSSTPRRRDEYSVDIVNSSSDRQPGATSTQGRPHQDMQDIPYHHPFSNPSAAAMMVAHHSGTSVQSIHQTTQMAHILGSLGSDLNPLDLSNFNAALENKRLDAYLASVSEGTFHREDEWIESSVKIRLPLDKKKMRETDAVLFEIGGVLHRDIVDVISSVYQSDAVRSFEHVPFREFWKPSEDAPAERLYGEIFSSEAMLDADADICKRCLENNSDPVDLEAVTVPLLLYSDSTHLANFGTASSWPVYMFFGSQSKYVRAMPTADACHHIAFMPSVRRIQQFNTLSPHPVTSYQTTFKTSTRNTTKQVLQLQLLRTANESSRKRRSL